MMSRLPAISFLCCLLLASCSFPTTTVFRGFAGGEAPFTLYNLQIERWNERRFSGLLALQRKTGGLYYALLDASGVSLIEAEIDRQGDFRLLQGQRQITKTGLPGYLSSAIYRVFGLDPEEYPCSFNGMLRFCFDSSPVSGWSKKAEAGPFTVWRAEGSSSDDGKKVTIFYEQPWGGVKIIMKQVSADGS